VLTRWGRGPIPRLPAVFNVTGGEVIIILVIALVVLGPEKLPDVLRKVGRVYGEVRRMANGFQQELRSTLDEPTREFRQAMDDVRTGFTETVRAAAEGDTNEPAAYVPAPEPADTTSADAAGAEPSEAPPLPGWAMPAPSGPPIEPAAISLPGSQWPPAPPPLPAPPAPAAPAAPTGLPPSSGTGAPA
jgi:sec-independent protein translocase protein TatB